MTPETEALVRSATEWAVVPFVPEVTLRTAAEPFGLWDRTERDAPPFWAFPWAGGQGLARYVLDHPRTVAGRRVLDVASGSGLVAIAAAKAGARTVTAGDIDENALAAITLNASANDTPQVTPRSVDLAAALPPGRAGRWRDRPGRRPLSRLRPESRAHRRGDLRDPRASHPGRHPGKDRDRLPPLLSDLQGMPAVREPFPRRVQ
jgi:SAM-dependent methyltransferase